MLKVFDTFREKLDSVMVKAFGHRIVLWGYGYTGQFLEWYADYYHSIKMDFIITEEWSPIIPYCFPLFRRSLFEFDYMDVKDAIVWLAIPEDKDVLNQIEKLGFEKDRSYFNFLEIIYGKDYINKDKNPKSVFAVRKTGLRDVQFMEWLEYMYGCNLVTAIDSSNFVSLSGESHSYRITTQKEIFPILDKCHCVPQENDAIFDFGCGKGGALLAFLDYGFRKVGGVEFEKEIYEVMISNFQKLNISTMGRYELSCIQGDARDCREILDGYNWFYYFDPFERNVFAETIKNISESLKRKPRRIYIININPKFYDVILKSGCFTLTNQFCVAMRQKVVDIFVSKKQYEGSDKIES